MGVCPGGGSVAAGGGAAVAVSGDDCPALGGTVSERWCSPAPQRPSAVAVAAAARWISRRHTDLTRRGAARSQVSAVARWGASYELSDWRGRRADASDAEQDVRHEVNSHLNRHLRLLSRRFTYLTWSAAAGGGAYWDERADGHAEKVA